jgi:hypothetical protein
MTMSCPTINTEVLAAMVEYHDQALRAIYAVALLLLVVLVGLGVERWERRPLWLRTYVAPKKRNKPRRPRRGRRRPVCGGRTKPSAPVHQQEHKCPQMDADAKEGVPHPYVSPNEMSKEKLRAHLARLVDGELDRINRI